MRSAAFGLALLPLALLAARAWPVFFGTSRALGANPIRALEEATGQWALRFVALALAVTPVRRLTGVNAIVKYRRMLGLFAFFYASVHLTIYAVLDMELDAGDLVADVVKHPYVTAGMVAWLMLLPLAVTSTRAMIRRLGGRRWQRLHRLTYAVAVVGTVHFWWSVKKDVTEPATFAVVFAVLLGWRVVAARARR
jgi:methionine sulfoxide reductase heme-binding subunit